MKQKRKVKQTNRIENRYPARFAHVSCRFREGRAQLRGNQRRFAGADSSGALDLTSSHTSLSRWTTRGNDCWSPKNAAAEWAVPLGEARSERARDDHCQPPGPGSHFQEGVPACRNQTLQSKTQWCGLGLC